MYEIQNALFNAMCQYDWKDQKILDILEHFETAVRRDEHEKAVFAERQHMFRAWGFVKPEESLGK
jgi:DNA-binding ferritin-like protein (Dps family)